MGGPEYGGVYRALTGARQLGELLERQLPNGTYDYVRLLVDGEYALLEWTSDAEGAAVTVRRPTRRRARTGAGRRSG
jgi:hypothetical protein